MARLENLLERNVMLNTLDSESLGPWGARPHVMAIARTWV